MKQFCKLGHDTYICGRQKNSQCRLCNRISTAKYRKSHSESYRGYLNKYHRKYAKLHRDKFKESSRRFRDKCKQRVFDNLGRICICCGETQIKFLQIDHINGGGRKEKLTTKIRFIYRKVEFEGYPKDKYQILCSNCNWAKGIYGICPHKEGI